MCHSKIGRIVSLLLIATLSLQGAVFCFATAESSGTWSFIEADNYIASNTVQISAGSASLNSSDDPVDWYNVGWPYRKPVTIDNTGSDDELIDYQVKITLNAGNFDYSKALVGGADIRLADSDGVSLLNYWIESWNNVGDSVVWVKLSSIANGVAKTIYLYYGNPAVSSVSSGVATFDFFDDFSSPSVYAGYYALSEPSLGLQLDQAWEQVSGIGPHTMSIVEWNRDGYRYWAYYGLAGGQGIGLARSNDLVTWTKYESNPLFLNGRWASAVVVGNQVYFSYTKDFEVGDQIAYLVLMKSSDGINFETVKTLVPKTVGQSNQNSNLFYNTNDGKYYLYWYNGVPGTWYIKARSAANVEDLDMAETITLLSDDAILAAPNMMYYGGTYFLSTESVGATWQTEIYGGISPMGPFTKLRGNPILTDSSACMFQHIFDNTTLLVTYCHIPAVSHVDIRTANLLDGRIVYRFPDENIWTRPGDTWTVVEATQPDATQGFVANTAIYQTSVTYTTAFSGIDYVVETYGKYVASRTWGLGLRVQDAQNFYSTNLYKNPDNLLYTYKWVAGGGQFLGGGGTVNIPADTWIKMKAKVYGNHIDIYLDDVLRSQITDMASTFPSGKVALYAEGGVTPQITQFDNFFVHKYAAVEPVSLVGGETTVYDNTNPTVQPSAANYFVFTNLYTFTETAVKNGGEIKYVLSNDSGVTWLYYNGAWIVSNGTYGESNTAAEIGANIRNFPSGGRKLIFRAFLHSDGTQLVKLDNLVIIGSFASASSSAFFIISNPRSSIIQPVQSQSLLLGSIEIKGASSDDKKVSSIQKVEVSTDGGATWVEAEPMNSNDNYGFTWKYIWNPPKGGIYSIKTRAINWMGNIETPESGIAVTITAPATTTILTTTPAVAAATTSAVTAASFAVTPVQIRAQIALIQQQLIVLIQQLIAQLLVELQSLQ